MKMVYAFKLCLSKRLSNHNCRDAMSEGFFPLSHSVLYRNGERQIGYIVQPENTLGEAVQTRCDARRPGSLADAPPAGCWVSREPAS